MLEAVSQLADLVLFILTVVVVGRRPTASKVAAMICIVAAVDYGFVALVAAQVQMNPIELYQQQLGELYAALGDSLVEQARPSEEMIALAAGISPAIYMVQSATYVFVGLCIRWIADRIRRRSVWSPFSEVDLSIWWLTPLLAGIGCYIVSLFLQDANAARVALLVAANLLVVSGIPLFVQGAAAGKGIMNGMGLIFALQAGIGALMILSGLAFIVVPVLGLIDFWANFRKLAREDDVFHGELNAE